MGSAEKPQVEPEASTEDASRAAVQVVIRKYTLESTWPSSSKDSTKSLILRMANEIAALFGKSIDDVSIEDIGRMQRTIEGVCSKVNIHKISFRSAKNAVELYQRVSASTEIITHIYWIGSAFSGNFGPAVRRLGIQFGGAPLARAAGIWRAGQAICELYIDAKKFKPGKTKATQYFPLFDSLSLDQYRELAVFMEIDARVAWDSVKLRKEILSEITSAYHNKVTALWSDAPQYKTILLRLCEELGVPEYQAVDSDELLEERIVQRVIADSIKTMTPDQLKRFEAAIRANVSDDYWQGSLKSTIFAGGLVAGKMTGFGLYIAASSGLAALGEGLGITFAFTTYTTLSSALSVAFGPIGIASAATVAALQWTKARPKRALPFVLYMAAARGYMVASSRPYSFADRIRRLLLKVRVRIGR